MKRKISKFLLSFIILFVATKDVYGAEVSMEYVYKLPAGGTNESGNYRILKSSRDSEKNYKKMDKIIIEEGSNKYIAYCIDVEKNLKNGDSISVYNQNLEQYLSSNNISNSKEIAKKINEYIYFGYKTSDVSSKEKGEYYAATQQLIWETLSNAGYRTTEYNSVIPFRLSINESETIDLSPEKNEIIAKINEYNKTPSFCNSQTKLEIAVGETATYTDNNKVLSKYKVSCSDGLKCQKDGNNLKVTVQKEDGEQKITFTKDGDGKGTTLYKSGDNQAVVINQGKVEPISCQFGIDTYKNVQTGGSIITGAIFLAALSFSVAYIMYLKKTTFKVDKGA